MTTESSFTRLNTNNIKREDLVNRRPLSPGRIKRRLQVTDKIQQIIDKLPEPKDFSTVLVSKEDSDAFKAITKDTWEKNIPFLWKDWMFVYVEYGCGVNKYTFHKIGPAAYALMTAPIELSRFGSQLHRAAEAEFISKNNKEHIVYPKQNIYIWSRDEEQMRLEGEIHYINESTEVRMISTIEWDSIEKALVSLDAKFNEIVESLKPATEKFAADLEWRPRCILHDNRPCEYRG